MKPGNPLNIYARELRNNSTDSERLLWRYLRNSQLEGVKFRRQQPIETYIVDFVSFEKRIVIELDGGQHAENLEYDEQKNVCLSANGFTVLRFWNNDVIQNTEGVLEVIRLQCLQGLPPPPYPLPPGEGEQKSKLQPPPFRGEAFEPPLIRGGLEGLVLKKIIRNPQC